MSESKSGANVSKKPNVGVKLALNGSFNANNFGRTIPGEKGEADRAKKKGKNNLQS
jgi:hypothetical protein